MSILERTFDIASDAIRYLESLVVNDNEIIFRGHANSSHTIQASYNRYTNFPLEDSIYHMDEIIETFKVGLIRHGIIPFESTDRQDWLEFARHHGLPTPCIDFTLCLFSLRR